MYKVFRTGKKGERVESLSKGTFKPMAKIDSIISGVTRSVRISNSMKQSYLGATKAYSKE